MERALAQARHAAAIGEVPVGAVLFRNGSVLAEAHNLIETTPNATAHAEMLVLNEAAKRLTARGLHYVDCGTSGARDPTAHAEIVALRRAARSSRNYRLPGATLYVTLEPCLMCLGAMVHARIARLVYGAPDPKKGAVDSVYDVLRHPANNHRVDISSGVLAEPSGRLLREFFAARRGKSS